MYSVSLFGVTYNRDQTINLLKSAVSYIVAEESLKSVSVGAIGLCSIDCTFVPLFLILSSVLISEERLDPTALTSEKFWPSSGESLQR